MSDQSTPQQPEQPQKPQEPQEETQMPSAGKQIMFIAIVIVGITVILGGGVMLSSWLG